MSTTTTTAIIITVRTATGGWKFLLDWFNNKTELLLKNLKIYFDSYVFVRLRTSSYVSGENQSSVTSSQILSATVIKIIRLWIVTMVGELLSLAYRFGYFAWFIYYILFSATHTIVAVVNVSILFTCYSQHI